MILEDTESEIIILFQERLTENNEVKNVKGDVHIEERPAETINLSCNCFRSRSSDGWAAVVKNRVVKEKRIAVESKKEEH